MEWQGGNKQRPNYWQWRRSFILGDSNWKSFQVGYPVDMYLSPNWMLSRVRSVKHFFGNALSRAHRGVLVPTSLWLGPIDSLPFATVVFWLHFRKKKNQRKSMERKLLCQLFTATSCSTLAQHALKLICQTTFDSILFKSLLSHAGQLSCCDVTEVTWPKTGFSAADDADARSVVFVFIQINTFTYLRKMSIYQTNSVYVKLYLYSTK